MTDKPLLVRRSATTWSDVEYLNRVCAKFQQTMMAYACRHFQEVGFNDDRSVIVDAVELRDQLNKLIEKSRVKNEAFRAQQDKIFGREVAALTTASTIDT